MREGGGPAAAKQRIHSHRPPVLPFAQFRCTRSAWPTTVTMMAPGAPSQSSRDSYEESAPAAPIERPAGSADAIWSEIEPTFDVLGERGLGLTMLVPEGLGHVREVPIYSLDGPWRQDPPAGSPMTSEAELAELRNLSQTLF